jgi:hypothetical protein
MRPKRSGSRRSTPFAARNGAGIVEILDKTGFKTYSEYMTETTPEQRRLLVKSIEAYHDAREA